jgi:hypothetical protein
MSINSDFGYYERDITTHDISNVGYTPQQIAVYEYEMKIGQRLRMCGLIAAYMSLFIP